MDDRRRSCVRSRPGVNYIVTITITITITSNLHYYRYYYYYLQNNTITITITITSLTITITITVTFHVISQDVNKTSDNLNSIYFYHSFIDNPQKHSICFQYIYRYTWNTFVKKIKSNKCNDTKNTAFQMPNMWPIGCCCDISSLSAHLYTQIRTEVEKCSNTIKVAIRKDEKLNTLWTYVSSDTGIDLKAAEQLR